MIRFLSTGALRRSALALTALALSIGGAAIAPAVAYPSLEMLSGKNIAPSPTQFDVSDISLLTPSPIALGAFSVSASLSPSLSPSFSQNGYALPSSNAAFLAGTFTTSAFTAASFLDQPAHRTIANDPFEGFNRFTFGLNDTSDKLFFKPLARGYRKLTTGKMRKALRNFLNHIDSAGVFVNDILQGQIGRAAQTGGRFIINTAIGFGGVADPAARLGIPDHSEDFGQTLAVWGVPSGPYVVLPFFGPSTVRDSFGRAVDSIALSPLNYVRTSPAQYARLSQTVATLIAVREPLLEPLEEIERNSLDYYSSFRSFYLQARRREILNGRTIIEDLPDLDDFDDFDG